MNAPRIVQVLDSSSAIGLLSACGVQGRLIGPVALDSDGNLWRFGVSRLPRDEHEADTSDDPTLFRRAWHRLPLPPLPNGEEAANV